MNFLFCSVGRRGELIKNFKKSLDVNSKIIATDCDKFAPALYFADKQFIIPKITDKNYLSRILDICEKEKIDVIATLIDPEISILSKNIKKFNDRGIKVLVPSVETAELCYDKYEMFKYLKEHGINTIMTYKDINEFNSAYQNKKCNFPVFIKPRNGSGSIGAKKIKTKADLEIACKLEKNSIIQEYMSGSDLNADVYVDILSHQPVSIFLKRKIETKIGGANKTISFKDKKLFDFIKEIISKFEFNGAIDMDFFYVNNEYFLSEINPRFGGSYLHAHGAGVDFIELIKKNNDGLENVPELGNYEEDILMLMYDSVVIKRKKDIEL